MTHNKSMDLTTGLIIDSTTVDISEPIKLKPNINTQFLHHKHQFIMVFFIMTSGNYISRSTVGVSRTRTQITPSNVDYGLLYLAKGIDLNTYQLEEGTVATPYAPYTESTQYLPNVGELKSVPSAKDEIRVSGGKAELVKRVILWKN